MFGCACVISGTESFLILCFRSEAVVWVDIYSMGYRVNGNIMVPHYNSSRRCPIKRRHGGYKLFVYFNISFDQFEICSIPDE